MARLFNKNKLHDNCIKCGLYKTCTTPFMPVVGEGRLKTLIIAEAPGSNEDRTGVPLTGVAARLLKKHLTLLGKNLNHDFWKTNAVICHPPKSKKPTKKQIKLCQRNIKATIEKYKPRFIWLLGSSAIDSLYLGSKTKIGITKLRGECIPLPEYDAWVFPMFHPQYVLRNEYDENLLTVFKRDLRNALKKMNTLKRPPAFIDYKTPVNVCTNSTTLIKWLKKILRKKPITAFDYETSNIKPYSGEEYIWSMSISTDTESYSFPLMYPKIVGEFPNDTSQLYWSESEYNDVMDLVEQYLTDPTMKKIAHNMKFEDIWSRIVLGVKPKGIVWCTMVNQHLIDDRRGICGLKHQSFVRWGIVGYEDNSKKYMKPVSSTDKRNRLHCMDLHELLLYNGIDSFLTMKLFREQQPVFRRNSEIDRCRIFYHKILKAFTDIQETGFCVDEKWYEKEHKRLTHDIDMALQNIMNDKHVKILERKQGKTVNINSVQQLRVLFFDILNLKPIKETTTGAPSLDVETLSKLDHPIAKQIIKYRKLLKLRDTYLSQFFREITNGKIHPFFDLHTVSTGRTSSSMPNFQNLPVRDEEAKKTIRTGIIPRPGNQILEVDYGSLEVRIIACYTKDTTLVGYVNDPTTDMHRDEAMNLFILPEEEVSKTIRFFAKNGWVFPQFYGSYYGSCGRELWANVVIPNLETKSGIKIQNHLSKKGIKSFDDFIEHLKEYEQVFWGRYPKVKEWQEAQFRYYRKNGHTKTMFGYQQRDYLSNNNLVNGPIQGAAAHCLLWSLVRINAIRKKEKWKTKILGQIHDSVILDVYPSERDHVLRTIKRVMVNDLVKQHSWIIVPMEVEPEITPIDGNWGLKTVCEIPK